MIDRREALKSIAGGVSSLALPALSMADDEPRRTGLGLVVYCQRFERAARKGSDLFEPMTFLEHCHRLGAGGMQADLGVLEPAAARRLRERAGELGMFVEAIVTVPAEKSQVERFDARMRTASEAGARAARTVIIPGRRYERFDSPAEFREFVERGRRSLELAAPVAERWKVPVAVENHKDQRTDQRIKMFEGISSEYVGACVDTGNSFALLEDPVETVKAFAPWAHAVHLKDQALREYPDGFLLADVPLGRGAFDLKAMVAVLREAKPGIPFALELITRDPLKVPCLTEKYWATMPDVPGADLARTLRTVREKSARELPNVSGQTEEGRLAMERRFVRESLDYARDDLGL